MRVCIGVMGSAGGELDTEVMERAHRLGRAIALGGGVLLTGAGPGYPLAAAQGAHEAGGFVIGVSPAASQREHRAWFGSPPDAFDVLFATGMGLMGREVQAVRSCDIVTFVGGRTGTLGEFAIAYEEGRLIGVLEGSGGVAGLIPDLERRFAKNTGARILLDRDPDLLVARLLAAFQEAAAAPPLIRGVE